MLLCIDASDGGNASGGGLLYNASKRKLGAAQFGVEG
jgi:hypothetical protein